jgi:hypothetical protein
LFIAASFAIPSVSEILGTSLPFPIGQVFLKVLGKRGMLVIWSWIIVVQVGTRSDHVRFMLTQGQKHDTVLRRLVDASRAVFDFARDNALPGSRYWKRMNR